MAANTMSLAGGPGAPTRPRGRTEAGLSIVVPVYNEAEGLAALHARIAEIAVRLQAVRRLATEVIYVDDGSRDATLAIAHALPADVLDIQVISLSRNFGKEAALLAGLDHARFGAVLFMDGDGQSILGAGRVRRARSSARRGEAWSAGVHRQEGRRTRGARVRRRDRVRSDERRWARRQSSSRRQRRRDPPALAGARGAPRADAERERALQRSLHSALGSARSGRPRAAARIARTKPSPRGAARTLDRRSHSLPRSRARRPANLGPRAAAAPLLSGHSSSSFLMEEVSDTSFRLLVMLAVPAHHYCIMVNIEIFSSKCLFIAVR